MRALVKGTTIAIDATTLEANAALRSIGRRDMGATYQEFRASVKLEAAVNGEADALVTHNLRDSEPATRLFGVRVLLPRNVLKELRR